MAPDDRGDNESTEPLDITVTPALVSGIIDLREAPSPDALVQFFASILEESDRAVPILCFAYIENEIKGLLQDATQSKRKLDDLFGLTAHSGQQERRSCSLMPSGG